MGDRNETMQQACNDWKPDSSEESTRVTVTSGDDLTTILIAEDNYLNQKVTLILLERLGLKTMVVANGAEAVAAVSRKKFSVILMDCHMPQMDGFEAARAIRKLEEVNNTYTPIIALTALAMTGDRQRCLNAGMDDYISKPIDRKVLKTKLDYWIRKNIAFNSPNPGQRFLRAKSGIKLPDVDSLKLEELEDFYGREQLSQMLALFSRDTSKLLRRIESFVGDRNSQSVAVLAHELRACCASIGAKQMFKTSLYLEQAAVQEDWNEVEELLKSFKLSFENLDHFLNLLMTA